MVVERRVVAAVVFAVVGVDVFLRRGLLAAALDGGSPTARTLGRVAEAWR
jgi:hypothetical protein